MKELHFLLLTVVFGAAIASQEFLEFKIKYSKLYQNNEEELFRKKIFLQNKANGNIDHENADRLSHEFYEMVDDLNFAADFVDFKINFQKNYKTDEERRFRELIFKENKQKIDDHNARYEKGLETYTMGINSYTDMLYIEVSSNVVEWGPEPSNENPHLVVITDDDLPKEIDWRKRGAVTEVKDQNPCGGCWAFAATAALESYYLIKKHQNVSLSEQNLLDCATSKYYNYGCSGGWPQTAFRYIKETGGINSDHDYPYEREQKNCRFNRNKIVATDEGYVQLQATEEALQAGIAHIGPMVVTINANDNFIKYKGGIYFDKTCDLNYRNHAVLVVGYGVDPEEGDFWLIKNSFGKGWGEAGFMRLARNKEYHCGIGSFSIYPLV